GGYSPPVFFGWPARPGASRPAGGSGELQGMTQTVALQDIAQQTVTGLGYELVEIERSAGGLLRVTIDLPWAPGAEEAFVNVEDCEKVTRQLQYALEVEGIDYKRLEVSSPGLDRP